MIIRTAPEILAIHVPESSLPAMPCLLNEVNNQ